MSGSIRAEIMTALAERLRKIKTNVGYCTDVLTVYSDEIPMGIQIADDYLPAILLIDGVDAIRQEQAQVIGTWEVELQLWDERKPDSDMQNFVRDVLKVIFADSATADRVGAFRELHPQIRQIKFISITPDLNMIEANRVYCITLQVEYKTKLINL